MKKLFFTTALSLLLVMGAFAQKKVLKGAEKAFKKGNIEQATTLAKQAAENGETSSNPSVYRLLGKISTKQYVDGGFAEIEHAQTALDWFNKALELADEKTKAAINEAPIFNPLDETKQIDGGRDRGLLEHHLVQESNKALDAEEYAKAYPMLEVAAQMDPTNVERAFFTGYAAENADNLEVAMKYFQKVMEHEGEYANKNYAYNKVIQAKITDEKYDEALEIIRKAKTVYPEEKLYSDWEVDVLVQAEKMDEAIKNIEVIIAGGNAKKENYYTLSFLQLNNEEYAKAEASAKKALELDPNYTEVFYVLGSSVFNQGADLMTSANNEVDDDSKYESLKQQALDKFKEAMPMFEKLVEADPEDLYALRPLSTIYDQLKMAEKRDALLDKIDKLEGGGE